jgi:hypothetical protein
VLVRVEVAYGFTPLAGDMAIKGPYIGIVGVTRLEVEPTWRVWLLKASARLDFVIVESGG